jgi:heme exporter protein A
VTALVPPPTVSPVQTVVSLRSAVCLRDGHPVLKGAHLDVGVGESLLVTGANGAGKSTLLRVLAGLVPLAAGDGRVLGHDLHRERAAIRREVALVGHDDACYVDLSVRENLHFHARAGGVRVALGDEWAERLGLLPLADRRVGTLSAGQRKRCALAVALLRRCELLMLDEPHAALDAQAREVIDEVISDVVRRGVTVLLVSHDRDRCRALVHREITVADGTISEDTAQ